MVCFSPVLRHILARHLQRTHQLLPFLFFRLLLPRPRRILPRTRPIHRDPTRLLRLARVDVGEPAFPGGLEGGREAEIDGCEGVEPYAWRASACESSRADERDAPSSIVGSSHSRSNFLRNSIGVSGTALFLGLSPTLPCPLVTLLQTELWRHRSIPPFPLTDSSNPPAGAKTTALILNEERETPRIESRRLAKWRRKRRREKADARGVSMARRRGRGAGGEESSVGGVRSKWRRTCCFSCRGSSELRCGGKVCPAEDCEGQDGSFERNLWETYEALVSLRLEVSVVVVSLAGRRTAEEKDEFVRSRVGRRSRREDSGRVGSCRVVR